MRHVPALLLLLMVAYVLFLTMAEAPAFGVVDVPSRNLVVDRYLDPDPEETGVPNAVARIIFDYRAHDTLGEATVLFVAVGAAAAVLVGRPGPFATRPVTGTDDPILRTVARLVIPFVQVYAVYVITHGHVSPGGGFAGGTILGGSFVLYLFVFGPGRAARKLSPARGEMVEGLTALWYILVGLGGLLLGASFLANAAAGFPLGVPGKLLSGGAIWLIGLGIGLKVAATVANLFLHLAGES
ncbi:MAG: MnhB domain-containing protein [bacterium]|nr:MnhB domain-containing protein [bacterium]